MGHCLGKHHHTWKPSIIKVTVTPLLMRALVGMTHKHQNVPKSVYASTVLCNTQTVVPGNEALSLPCAASNSIYHEINIHEGQNFHTTVTQVSHKAAVFILIHVSVKLTHISESLMVLSLVVKVRKSGADVMCVLQVCVLQCYYVIFITLGPNYSFLTPCLNSQATCGWLPPERSIRALFITSYIGISSSF